MSPRNRVSVSLFILTLITGLTISQTPRASSVEHLSTGTDTRFLPYRFNASGVITNLDLRGGMRPRRVMTVGSPSIKSECISVGNPPLSVKFPSHVCVFNFPVERLLGESPVDLTITDVGVCRNGAKDSTSIWLSGYRNDSSWIMTFDNRCNPTGEIFLVSGQDETGDGLWKGSVMEVGSMDYDYDGTVELFVYVSAERDLNNRTLCCVDVRAGRIEWKLPVASPIAQGRILNCRDSLNPGVIVASYNVGQGATDANFSDQFGYLTRINGRGEVVWNRVVTGYPDGIVPLSFPDDTRMYLGHTVRFLDPGVSYDSLTPQYLLSIFDVEGNPQKTITVPEPIQWLWRADCNSDGSDELYVQSTTGIVRVFSRDLELTHESDTLPFTYIGRFDNWPDQGQVLLMQGNNETVVLSPGLKLLATLPLACGYAEAVRIDSSGELETLLACSGYAYGYYTIEQNGIIDYVIVLYHENQAWVLVVLFSLLTGLVVTNFFRRRVSRQKSTLEEAHRELKSLHEELEEAHRDLQQAHATIITQEKYRQAKDIAGGFAHEIRNALFPADSSLTRLRSLGELAEADPDKVKSLLTMTRAAVERAIDITKQISDYTKLESEFSPEKVRLRAVVDRIVSANRLRIDDAGVRVKIDGDGEVAVMANSGQLFSVFNNLFLNSLDALTGRADPGIIVRWLVTPGEVCVTFRDNGVGIPEKDRERVFDAFFSTKPSSGTGLGLSVAKRVVEMYGGAIKAGGRPGEGAVFEIRLKLAAAE
jgi:signal transduction histidine kinase